MDTKQTTKGIYLLNGNELHGASLKCMINDTVNCARMQ